MPDHRITALVLQEFRLHDEDTAGNAARLVAAFSDAAGPSVPLLVSVDDPRDVAIVRGLRAGEDPEGDPRQRGELAHLATGWQPLRHYTPRIAERSGRLPSHHRLAVTESGINGGASDPDAATPEFDGASATSSALGLLWIGVPTGTHAGLLVLLGSYDDGCARPDARDWPLPLSRYLGVRIYDSR